MTQVTPLRQNRGDGDQRREGSDVVPRRASYITERAWLPLGMVAAVLGIVAIGAWNSGSKFTAIEASGTALNLKADAIATSVVKMDQRLDAFEAVLGQVLTRREFDEFKARVERIEAAALKLQDFEVWLLLAQQRDPTKHVFPDFPR